MGSRWEGQDLDTILEELSGDEEALVALLEDELQEESEEDDAENDWLEFAGGRLRYSEVDTGNLSRESTRSQTGERMRSPLVQVNHGGARRSNMEMTGNLKNVDTLSSTCNETSSSEEMDSSGSSSESTTAERGSEVGYGSSEDDNGTADTDEDSHGNARKRRRYTESVNPEERGSDAAYEPETSAEVSTTVSSTSSLSSTNSRVTGKKRRRKGNRWTNGTKETRCESRSSGTSSGSQVSQPIRGRAKRRQDVGPAADGGYSFEERRRLRAAMVPKCHFCGELLKQRTMVLRHMLFRCNSICLPPALQAVLDGIREKSGKKMVTAVPAKTFKYQPCPQDGLCEVTCTRFPEGVVCAPHNWLCINMDSNQKGKAQNAIKGTKRAHEYTHKFTGEKRKRFYTDKPVHTAWENIMRGKIANNEVRELLVPVTYWYENADIFSVLQGRNHANLISIKFKDGKWTEAVMHDSLTDNRYYIKATGSAVRHYLKSKLFPNVERHPDWVGKEWLRRADPYKSLATAGCQGVLAFWLHLKYLGMEVENPMNTGTVLFFKALLHHVPPNHPLMRGEEFDRQWTLKKKMRGTVAASDPEMKDHIAEFTALVYKLCY